jgi:vacuolar protein sorting-associated protein 3
VLSAGPFDLIRPRDENVLMAFYRTASADRTARLLNSQAVNLDVVDVGPLRKPFTLCNSLSHLFPLFQVISLVPPDWPLKTLSTFLSRSFRRSLHARHEAQIVKAIGAGQNLEVSPNGSRS